MRLYLSKHINRLERFFSYAVRLCLILLVIFYGAPYSTQAASGVPTILSFQGRLLDSSSNLLGGSGTTFYFKFSIWDNPTVGSGTKLWPSTVPATTTATVRQGVFNVNIGDTSSGYPDVLDYNFNRNDTIYLQVEVSSDNNSSQTLSPRQRIAASAFAELANAVSGTSTQSSFGTTTPILNTQVTIESTTTSSIPLSIRASSGQTANLLQVQNSSASNIFYVGPAGGLFASSTLQVTDVATFYSSFLASGLATLSGGVLVNNSSSTITNLTTINSTSTNATTTNLAITATASTSVLIVNHPTATSTVQAGLSIGLLNVTRSNATSTFANGITVTAGCFSINGTCLSTSGGGSGTVNAGTAGQLTYYSSDGTTVSGTSTIFLSTNSRVGIGTTSPASIFSIHGSTWISGDITNVANIIATGTITSTGATTTNLAVTNAVNVTGALTVTGLSTLSGGVLVNNSTSTITNLTMINSTTTNATTTYLSIANLASTSKLIVSNPITVNGAGTSSFAGGISAAGLASSQGLTLTGGALSALSFPGTLATLGVATSTPGATLAVQGTLLGSGQTNLAGLTATGTTLLALSSGTSVGIGTSSPAKTFSVQGDEYISGTSTVSGIVATSSVYLATVSGSVNIGTTTALVNSSTTSSLSPVLVVAGSASTTIFIDSNSPTTTNAVSALAFTINGIATSSIQVNPNTSDGLTFTTGGILTPSNIRLVIRASGAVGIGTTSPSALLAVQGNLLLSGDITNVANVTATGTLTVAGLATFNGNATMTQLTVTGNAYLNTTSGKTGVGTTSPGATLAVQGTILGSGQTTFAGLTATGTVLLATGGSNPTVGIGTTSPWGEFSIEAVSGTVGARSPIFVVSNAGTSSPFIYVSGKNGNVGIGTTSPWGQFSIESNKGVVNATTPIFVVGDSATATPLLYVSGVNGNVGIGTTTPTAKFTVVSVLASQAPIFMVSTSTVATPALIVASTTNVGIGTDTPQYNFTVARKTSAFNSGADGSLLQWSTSTIPLPTKRSFQGAAIYNGFLYIVAGSEPGTTRTNTVIYSKINSDGTLGAWATSTNVLVGRRSQATAVAANGYLYLLGGWDGGKDTDTVFYSKLGINGSPGAWATSTNRINGLREDHSSAVANGYIYVIGGFNAGTGVSQTSVLYAKLNSDGTTGPWATSTNGLPAVRFSQSSVVANGCIYAVAGADDAVVQDTLYYAQLNADGSTGAWKTNANSFPNRREYNRAFVANGYLYSVAGWQVNPQADVFFGKINNDCSVQTIQSTNSLPARTHAGSALFYNGYVYYLGGTTADTSTSAASDNRIFIGSAARVLISGSLDLIGLSSTSASSVGDDGSSIYAGNIYSKNNLEVSGSAYLWNSLGVNGILTLNASTSLTQILPIFTIITATSSDPIITALYNGQVGIGTSTPWGQFSIEATSSLSGAPTFVVSDAATNTPFLLVSGKNGYVGVGTVTPFAILSVNAQSNIPSFVVGSSTATAFIIDQNMNIGIGGTTSPMAKLAVVGSIAVTGCVKAATSSLNLTPANACADIAESYDTAESVEGGDIVAISSNENFKTVKATASHKMILGPVSSHPAVLFEGSFSSFGAPSVQDVYLAGDKIPVALSGRVPVKVNLENGPIATGDPITISSEVGVGMKAIKSGKIVGYALENYTGLTEDNKGRIEMFVALGYWRSPSESDVGLALNAIIDAVKDWLKGMEIVVEQGLVRLKDLIAENITAHEVKTDKLCIEDVCVGKAELKILLEHANIQNSSPATITSRGGESVPSDQNNQQNLGTTSGSLIATTSVESLQQPSATTNIQDQAGSKVAAPEILASSSPVLATVDATTTSQ